jgi:HK97 gp10 family phage protein
MARKAATVSIEGIDEIREKLKDTGVREGRNIMRATIRAVAARITKEAKLKAPLDSGTLKQSIKLRPRKSTPDNPVFEVWAGSSKGSKYDAYYWRFVEYGTSGKTPQPERPFIRPAVEAVRAELPSILRDEFGKKWEKAMTKRQRNAAKIPGES